MILFYIAALACLMLTAASEAQRPLSTSVCERPDSLAAGAVLTICTHERGMTALPQGRLYLRLFADGRAEYERNPSVIEGDARGYLELEIKEIRVTPAELKEILRLGREPGFQGAEANYKRIRIWDDSSRETTIIFRDGGMEKKIVLNNYMPELDDNVEFYPWSLNSLMSRAQEIWERANGIVRTTPTINFCELMLNRSKYVGKRMGIYADLEHNESVTRDGKYVSINEFLHAPECDSPDFGRARTAEKIGIMYPDESAATVAIKAQIAKLVDKPYHGRARVVVFGILRKAATPSLYGFDYQFEIGEFKSIEPIILPYQGKLHNGWTYSDTFDHAGGSDLILSSPLKPELHHAERIEWRDAGEYLSLIKRGRKHIVFRVIYVTTQMIAPNRWNDTHTCEILELK